MSTEINKAFVQQYEAMFIRLAQQEGSRLMSTVMVKKVVGKYDHFDRIGATAAQKKVSRHGDTPLVDTPHSRRRLILDDYEWADLIDKADEVRLLVDPTSVYAQNGADAMGRAIDAVIVAAALGNATSIDSADASSSVALPTSQIVSEDFGSTNTNLTIAKLIEAKRLLDKNDVKQEDRFFILNASALASLLNTTQVTSSDYNTVKALVRGELDTFLGFKFVMYNNLPGVADGTDTVPVKCLAYCKSGIGLGLGQDVNVRIAERADKSFSTQVFASMSIGAVRIEEEKVVQIGCVQS